MVEYDCAANHLLAASLEYDGAAGKSVAASSVEYDGAFHLMAASSEYDGHLQAGIDSASAAAGVDHGNSKFLEGPFDCAEEP